MMQAKDSVQVANIEADGFLFTVGSSVWLDCGREGQKVGIIREILPSNDYWNDFKQALVVEAHPDDWLRISSPPGVYSIRIRYDRDKNLIAVPASRYWVKPARLEELVTGYGSLSNERDRLRTTISSEFGARDKTRESILESLWYGYHAFGKRVETPISLTPTEPVYGWAAFKPDGSLGSFAKTKHSLLVGYDLIPLRGLDSCEQGLLDAGFQICEVKVTPLPLESSEGYYTALFRGQFDLDLLSFGGLSCSKFESEVMGKASRKKEGWEPGRINYTGFLETLCGYLTRNGCVDRYGWRYGENKALRLVWIYGHRDDDRYKQRYEDLKLQAKAAIAKRGITFAKVLLTPCLDAPIKDEILSDRLV